MYDQARGEFRTPGGAPVSFVYRTNTNDYNTLYASSTEDEYHLGAVRADLSGWALDIGGYLGSVGIGLAIDHPALRVLIVEPVPSNLDYIELNIGLNDVGSRVFVIDGGAAGPDTTTAIVHHGYRGTVNAAHHAFVGNALLVENDTAADHDDRTVACYSIRALAALARTDRFVLAKVDCEGCEWSFLDDPAVVLIDQIIGEWHPTPGPSGAKTQADLVALLGATHEVTWDGPHAAGPQGFRAVLR